MHQTPRVTVIYFFSDTNVKEVIKQTLCRINNAAESLIMKVKYNVFTVQMCPTLFNSALSHVSPPPDFIQYLLSCPSPPSITPTVLYSFPPPLSAFCIPFYFCPSIWTIKFWIKATNERAAKYATWMKGWRTITSGRNSFCTCIKRKSKNTGRRLDFHRMRLHGEMHDLKTHTTGC